MEPTNLRRLTLIVASATLLPLTMVSCEDELLDAGRRTDTVEGLPATVDLTLELSDMPVQTRALIDDAGANNCADLWIGIFRASDDSCVYNNLFDETAAYVETVDAKYQIVLHNIETVSGPSRIVAVANATTCDALASPTSHDIITLDSALTAARTWDEFTSIVAKRSDTTDIYQLTYNITMAGYYSENDTACSALSKNDVPTVDIEPGGGTLEGVIKLRRLITFNTFYIHTGPNITLELESWQVCNNPYYSYVFPSTHNAGDDNGTDSVYNYANTSVSFKLVNDTTHSFEFYQFENLHTACTYQPVGDDDWVGIRNYATVTGMKATDMYYDREREYKETYSDANRTRPAAAGAYHRNTGLYKSLLADTTQTPRANNNASYIRLKGHVSYYIADTEANRNNPQAADPEAYDSQKKQIFRSAEVEYTIHLGYCEGKDATTGEVTYATARDFNCRRNTRYTYNVTVNGVKNIVVEAKKEGEPQSGAEGLVYDAFGEYRTMDSHYNVFNIKLTNAERQSLRYYIVAPYDGVNHTYDSNNYTSSWETDQFYTWIKFKPTADSTTLAVYKINHDGVVDTVLWSLNDLKDVAGHPNDKDQTIASTATDLTDTHDRWYTVFIDEYVYHKKLNGTSENGTDYGGYDETTWRAYVDQEDRTVDFIVNSENSKDDNSIYMLCKYAFSQRAIQTYYNTRIDAALGVEHTNESYGLNYNWDSNVGSYETLKNTANGRQNLYNACASSRVGNKWNKVILETVPEHIAADINTTTIMNNKIPESTPPVMQLYDIGNKAWSCTPSPSSPRYHYVNTACMNRNRDLDGDGVISTNEMRWYLPTYSQYTQIMIGLSGLVSPLIDWQEHPNTLYSSLANYAWNNTSVNTTLGRQNFHFAASDGSYIWADEGYSRGGPIYTQDNWANIPYEIRCVRYLGKNPGTTPSDTSEVIPAYHQRGTTMIIDAPYYNSHSTRPYVSGYLAPADISSEIDRPYLHFQIADSLCHDLSDKYIKVKSNYTMDLVNASGTQYPDIVNHWYQSLAINGICGQYTQEEGGVDKGTWRVPNAKELAMMVTLNIGIYGNMVSSTTEYFITFPGNTCEYCFFGRVGAVVARSVLKNYSNLTGDYIRCVRDVK